MSAITSSLSTSTISFSVHPGFTSYGRYGRTAPLGVRGGVGLHTGDSNPPPFIQPPSCGRHHSQVSCMISAFCVGSTRAAQFGRLLRFRAWCGTAPVRVTLGRGAPTRLPRASGSHSSGQRHYVVDCYLFLCGVEIRLTSREAELGLRLACPLAIHSWRSCRPTPTLPASPQPWRMEDYSSRMEDYGRLWNMLHCASLASNCWMVARSCSRPLVSA